MLSGIWSDKYNQYIYGNCHAMTLPDGATASEKWYYEDYAADNDQRYRWE